MLNILDIISDYCKGDSSQKIAIKCGVSRQRIDKILKDNKIQKRTRRDYRKYSLEDSFFEKIDSETKAYFLGFLFADGYNQYNRGIIKLALIDKDILIKFKNAIRWTGEILPVNTPNNRPFFEMHFVSHVMSERLQELGCTQAKSLTLKWPHHIPEELVHHFIRGYFDGDGWMSISGTPTFGIASTKNFLMEMNRIINERTGIGIKKLENHPNNPITKFYRLSGRLQIAKIYAFLYKNAVTFLARKKKNMEAVCEAA
jgi:hypothetical protein